MNVRDYYDDKKATVRSLTDGEHDFRNTHNFIKACLIMTQVPSRSHVLDIGCGRGGDFLKYKRSHLKSFCGIDLSHENIEQASVRAMRSGIRCRVRLNCMDFTTQRFCSESYYDVVSAQFSLHFAFRSVDTAHFVIEQIADSLKPGGLLLGTIPVHVGKQTGDLVSVKLPGDDRLYEEYCATREDVESTCLHYGLTLEFWTPFDAFFVACVAQHPELQATMQAFATPDVNNAVFLFRKSTSTR